MAYQCGLFNAKVILVEEQHWYYLTYNWGNKGESYFSQRLHIQMYKSKLYYFCHIIVVTFIEWNLYMNVIDIID